MQQEDANSSDSAPQTRASGKKARIPRAPAPQAQRESKASRQEHHRSRAIRARLTHQPIVSSSTESVEDPYEGGGWGGEGLHRTRHPYGHWAPSGSVPTSAQYGLNYNAYQAQGMHGGQLALRMGNPSNPYGYSPYQQQSISGYYQHNPHMNSPIHQPSYGGTEMVHQAAPGYFQYPGQYQMTTMPQYYHPAPTVVYQQPVTQPVTQPVAHTETPPAPVTSSPIVPTPAPEPPAPAAPPPPDPSEYLKEVKQMLLDQKKEQEEKEAAAKKAEEDRKAKAAADKKIADDLAAARKEAAAKATTEAEKKAAEEAKKKDAELAAKAKKEAEEAKKKADEEAKKKAEVEAAKPPPPPPAKKKPIKFKDAVGRKFSFPFHLCDTWEGMEDLIKQAFLHVDVIGPHVAEGHYDLVGPDGEIILPQVWKTVIEPDWTITMHLWPIPEPPPPEPPAADVVVDVPAAPAQEKPVRKGHKAKKQPQPPAPPTAPIPPPPPPGPSAAGPAKGTFKLLISHLYFNTW